MAARGWGSYFMHSRVGPVTQYLSPEWMRLIRACAEEARKTGTLAWLYDEMTNRENVLADLNYGNYEQLPIKKRL